MKIKHFGFTLTLQIKNTALALLFSSLVACGGAEVGGGGIDTGGGQPPWNCPDGSPKPFCPAVLGTDCGC